MRESTVRRLIVALPVLYVAASAAVLGVLLVQLRNDALDSAERAVAAFVRLAEEQTARTLQTVEQTFPLIESELAAATAAGALDVESMRVRFRRLLESRPFLRAMWMLDAAGRIVLDSDIGNVGLDVSDRKYFLEQTARADGAFRLGDPVLSRTGAGWFVPATQALRAPDGAVAGVIVAAIEMNYFERVWRREGADAGVTTSLFRRDGTLLMRIPKDEARLGRNFADGDVLSHHIKQAPAGVARVVSPVDGRPRLTGYRTLDGHPDLVIIVSETQDHALRDWRRTVVVVGAGWLAASVSLCLLGLGLAREWRVRRETEARYRMLFQANPHATAVIDAQTGRYLAVNDTAVRKYGWSRTEFMAMARGDLRVPGEGWPVEPAKDSPVGERPGEAPAPRMWRGVKHRCKDGGVVDVDVAEQAIVFEGRPALLVMAQDVTDRVRAETARRAAEEQLRQAQKMEAVGQLTGGVAHDFNNMLTVIIGNVEMARDRVAHDAELRGSLDMVLQAAESSAELTARLLAFARRQPLQPRRIEVNRFVAGIGGLLRRALGEHVDLKLIPADDFWDAAVDPAQLETAILNLAINARDAMPDGGRLTIETHNKTLDEAYAAANRDARAGDFVVVAVSDTGTGMAPDVVERVFEPFFTTKEVGRGTGLGLSMVYGFVRQSGGHVKIYSEVGVGTTIRLYLPRAAEGAVAPEDAEATKPVPLARGETVLLVEDDDLVRAYVEAQLVGLGYRTTTAPDGPAALAILESGEPFDLLFSDVVMPGGMNGRQLAEAARRLRPGLRVLFTSGYTQNAIVHGGRLDADARLLSKPYRLHDLAVAIRQALDEA